MKQAELIELLLEIERDSLVQLRRARSLPEGPGGARRLSIDRVRDRLAEARAKLRGIRKELGRVVKKAVAAEFKRAGRRKGGEGGTG